MDECGASKVPFLYVGIRERMGKGFFFGKGVGTGMREVEVRIYRVGKWKGA